MTSPKTTPMTPDPPHVERRSSWRDEHLDCICGLANGRGGVLDIGREVRREAIGATDLLRLAEEIPIKVQSVLNIVVNVHVRSDRGRDYLRIAVPAHPDRALPQMSPRKQPENPDQPANSQKAGNRILDFLRENPSASRREIAEALPDATEGSVRHQVDKLKAAGKLRRVGPDRGGHWAVISQKTARKPPEDDQKTTRNAGQPPESRSLSDRILSLLRRNPSASRREIATSLGTTRSTVRYRLDKLREAGRVERVGPDKGGHWRVLGEPATEPDQ